MTAWSLATSPQMCRGMKQCGWRVSVSEVDRVGVQGRRCEVVDHTALAPSLVISHEITEDSPLHGLTIEDIQEANGAIFVSVAATDDNHLQVAWQEKPPLRMSRL